MCDKTSKEVKLIKIVIEHLLDAELLAENGWSEEDVNMLNLLLDLDFEIKFIEEE